MWQLPWILALSFILFEGTTAFAPNYPQHSDNERAMTRTRLLSAGISDISEGESTPSRRELLQWGGAALSSYILGVPGLPAAAEGAPKNILLTGSNSVSGIGFQAALRLAKAGHNLILPARSLEKSKNTVEKLKTLSTEPITGSLLAAECNLASMASISTFVAKLPQLLGEGQMLDTVCLNAGLARNTDATDVLRTEEGFELTVGTNHFGHFYLHHLLLPKVQPNDGRFVVTASGVHDPASPGGAQGKPATLGDLTGLERDGRYFEMVDGGPFNADKAYKDSKLCNVMFTRELQRRLDSNPATSKITANCFNPGLIVGTGLFRDQNPFFTKAFDVVATDLFKVGESAEWGGGALAYVTGVDTKGSYYSSPPGSSKYGAAAYGKQFTASDVSAEAQDNAKAKRLWELSEKLLGIST